MKSLAFSVFCLGAACGIVFEYNVPSPRASERQYQRRLRAECLKCGSSSIQVRYCEGPCQTPCPTQDEKKRGGVVYWAHEHLHRTCKQCGYDKDAMECADKEQP